MAQQLEAERNLTGDASAKTLMKEMVLIPGNRKRTIISVMLMVCQQMTGVNAIVSPSPSPPFLFFFSSLGAEGVAGGVGSHQIRAVSYRWARMPQWRQC